MRLYVWRGCEYMKQYAGGTIAVVAGSAEAARGLARIEFERHVDDYYSIGPWNDDYQEVREDYRELLEIDLAREPEVVETLFISGSA